jgi:hypothetical protein
MILYTVISRTLANPRASPAAPQAMFAAATILLRRSPTPPPPRSLPYPPALPCVKTRHLRSPPPAPLLSRRHLTELHPGLLHATVHLPYHSPHLPLLHLLLHELQLLHSLHLLHLLHSTLVRRRHVAPPLARGMGMPSSRATAPPHRAPARHCPPGPSCPCPCPPSFQTAVGHLHLVRPRIGPNSSRGRSTRSTDHASDPASCSQAKFLFARTVPFP